MIGRLDLAKSKGCDGVEPDNIDVYTQTNGGGFKITYQDQITYNTWLAREAHNRDLSIGLKNDVDQVKDLVTHFDWALNEQCYQYNECDTLIPFIRGKSLFVYSKSEYILPSISVSVRLHDNSSQLHRIELKFCNTQNCLGRVIEKIVVIDLTTAEGEVQGFFQKNYFSQNYLQHMQIDSVFNADAEYDISFEPNGSFLTNIVWKRSQNA